MCLRRLRLVNIGRNAHGMLPNESPNVRKQLFFNVTQILPRATSKMSQL